MDTSDSRGSTTQRYGLVLRGTARTTKNAKATADLRANEFNGLFNEEIRGDIEELARTSSPELNLRRIGWIFEAREQMLEFNVPVALALEAMMVALKVPERS